LLSAKPVAVEGSSLCCSCRWRMQ